MKIIFLCGCLEPGRTGLGDYIRRLAGELTCQGHIVGAIALNDEHLQEVYEGSQTVDNVELLVCRLPSLWCAKDRFNYAANWIDKINPEWLCLQFVIFSFQSKGLPFGLGKSLKKIGEGRRWHIMFQELWVGMGMHDSIKHLLWGWIQKQILKSLLRHLKPSVVHTSSYFFQHELAKLGVKAGYLPLFSNIQPSRNLPMKREVVRSFSNPTEPLRLVLFGYIYPDAPINQFAKEVALLAKEKAVQISLTLLGRSGPEQDKWVSVWKAAGLNVEVLGEQQPLKISEILDSSALGLATTSMIVVEKSSAVATMRAHGLPVLCVAKQWTPRCSVSLPNPSGVFEYTFGNLESNLTSNVVYTTEFEITVISRQLTEALIKVSK